METNVKEETKIDKFIISNVTEEDFSKLKEQLKLLKESEIKYKYESFTLEGPRGSSIKFLSTGSIVIEGHESEEDYKIVTEIISNKKLSLIGSDEVGTGDVFGPIVVCAAYVPAHLEETILGLGVKDTKKLTDEKVRELYSELINYVEYHVDIYDPISYCQTVRQGINMNALKAIGHNSVITSLKNNIKNKRIDGIIVDKFGPEYKYYEYLEEYCSGSVETNIQMETKAESKYTSVAVAAIIARYHFLEEMDRLSEYIGEDLLKGSTSLATEQAKKLYEEKGFKELSKVAKVTFKNVQNFLKPEDKY